MNRLRRAKQAQIISALVEGNSLRATSRMTGVSKVTILRLLESLGAACAAYQDKVRRNLTCKRIQSDGTRGAATAYEFMHDLAGRLANRVQLTTDGHRVYLDAVESAFGSEISGEDPR